MRILIAAAALAAAAAPCAAKPAAKARALLAATAAGSTVAGVVDFEETKAGLKVTARLTGVPAGAHGFHIHEFGSCADAGKAAGGHYNPKGAPHGHAVKSGIKRAHAGDLGNVEADAKGDAVLEAVLPKVALSRGRAAVAGRAVILHEKADDFGQPLGNAGGRIGCGVIAIAP